MYIFILGLDHSRSTIIDMVLAEKLGGLSLGEVRRTAFPKGGEVANRLDCSCGSAFDDCSVWQKLAGDYIAQAKALLAEGRIIVDSSKDISHYRKLNKHMQPHMTVITHRRFEDWYKSILASGRRDNSLSFSVVFRDRRFILAGLRLFLRRFRPIAKFEWAFTQWRFLRAVSGPAVLITEDGDIDRLVEDLGRSKWPTEKHIVRGNRVSREDRIELKAFNEADGYARFLKRHLSRKTASHIVLQEARS